MNDFSDIVINAQTVLNDLDKVIEVSKAVKEENDEEFLTSMEFIRFYLVKYFTILKKDREEEKNESRN